MPIHYNTLSTLLQFSMFILSIFNCKGEQSAKGGDGEEGGGSGSLVEVIGANFILTVNIFKTLLRIFPCCC